VEPPEPVSKSVFIAGRGHGSLPDDHRDANICIKWATPA
jgi:hypothetical protein